MSAPNPTNRTTTLLPAPAPSDMPSSSLAFGTPVHPLKPHIPTTGPPQPTVLPILLPPPTLRPLAFRTFTKKHNLTLTSSALQALATFVGRNCGSGWREDGLAEGILEEIAKSWKKGGGGVIVAGDSNELKTILRNLEGTMLGGRILQNKALSRQHSLSFDFSAENGSRLGNGERPRPLGKEDGQKSLCIPALEVDDDQDGDQPADPRSWLKVIGAFEHPRMVYNVGKKHFEKLNTAPSLLPPPLHKTLLFRHRYSLIHQRLLRNESFQTSTFAPARARLQRASSNVSTAQQSYKLTPIANLLGRSGSSHLILGLLAIAPTGNLAISDLTGSIALDVQHAAPTPVDGAWFAPGMIVLVDGMYEEEHNPAAGGLGGNGGIGGTIGGKFIGFSVIGPPCERREVTLGVSGVNGEGDSTAAGGFGWVDFLGVGSERALGSKMRRMEQRVLGRGSNNDDAQSGRSRMIILGEVNLDNARTLEALRKVFGIYAAESVEDTPLSIVLIGNFVRHAVMAGGGSGGSIEYKEYFDSLASTLSDFPTLLQSTTFVFVPGDNDPWVSAFSAGAATVIPRKAVPEMFTSRIKRAFGTANAEAERANGKKADGEAIWTSNPTRLSLFGPAQEVVFFRDDMSSRLRRTAIRFRPQQNAEDIVADDLDLEMSAAPTIPPGELDEEKLIQGRMEVDSEVQTAASHLPASKAKVASDAAPSTELLTARKLVKAILDQGYLSPFPLSVRPVLWDQAGALQLYPLPTALVLADAEAPPFAVTYEGCHVMNPGRLLALGRRGVTTWIEYDTRLRKGTVKEVRF
ncbi:MAG: DNA-directed DNA polymerase epsilon, subunit B [Candelina mexicana]|nr:MAG: DNA-directed DNA polymerase epsilon, subunit B [Candelina mexicana]